tara:strand:- start:1644 stop:1880 length:237 start_codon:yes stop_codon:yes gene_type:complete
MSDVEDYIEPDMDFLVVECPCGNRYHKGEEFVVDDKEVCSECASEAKYCDSCGEYTTTAIAVEDVYVCDEDCKKELMK